MKRRFALVLTALTLALSAQAQTAFPNKPIKLVVPLAPGGATDTVARVVARHLSESLKSPVVVENRTGANGLIALESMTRTPADGYTLFVGNVSTNALAETVQASKLKAKPTDALTGVTMLAIIPHLLVSSAAFEPQTLPQVVSYAKAHPGKVNHASPGVGSYSMLDMLTFEKAAGLDMVHVPYNGGAGQYTGALVANDVQLAFINASSVLEMVKGGKLRALAVTTPERLPQLPGVPTMAEAGYPGIGTNAWQGLFAPRGTPAPVLKMLHEHIAAVLRSDEVKQTFEKTLIVPTASKSAAEFDAFVRAETTRWAKTVKDMNVKPE
jgi:tripartite-type tricarboxylate transporter receptor subunit TctC